MRILDTGIEGAHLVQMEPVHDERGFFARAFDREVFARMGMSEHVARGDLSYNRTLGTLRGLHAEAAPSRDTRLLRVFRGRLYAVVADLRPASRTFGRWHGAELAPEDGSAIYVPAQCGFGFMTLEDDTELFVQHSEPARPDLSLTVRWDDPGLDIEWPLAPRVIARPDAEAPWLSPETRQVA